METRYDTAVRKAEEEVVRKHVGIANDVSMTHECNDAKDPCRRIAG